MAMRTRVDKGIISHMAPALDDVVDGEEVLAIEGMRMLGFWSARAIFLMEFLYVAVFIAGFASIRNTSKPLPDPYLAIAEILILLMAPVMVCLMLAIHECAPRQREALHPGCTRMDAGRGGLHHRRAFRAADRGATHQLSRPSRATHRSSAGNGPRLSTQSTSSPGTSSSGWLSCSPSRRLRIGEMQSGFGAGSSSADRCA